jgi:hypothetical protein
MKQNILSYFKKMVFITLGAIMILTLVPQSANAQLCTTGGMVPCNRNCDDPGTPGIDDSQPCNLCAVFYMLKTFINYVTTISITVGVFILIFSGLLYAISAGDPGKVQLAKAAATSVLTGLAIISVSWLGIAFILEGMGYANIGVWSQVVCTLPT